MIYRAYLRIAPDAPWRIICQICGDAYDSDLEPSTWLLAKEIAELMAVRGEFMLGRESLVVLAYPLTPYRAKVDKS